MRLWGWSRGAAGEGGASSPGIGEPGGLSSSFLWLQRATAGSKGHGSSGRTAPWGSRHPGCCRGLALGCLRVRVL